MAHYLFRASYTQQGIQGVMKEGAVSRISAVREMCESLGGSLETAYWAFGETDFIAIAELPDNAAAAAAATRVASTGIGSVTTTVLLTAAEIDDAIGRSVSYRPPGA